MSRRLHHVGLIQGIEVTGEEPLTAMKMLRCCDASVACIATWVSIWPVLMSVLRLSAQIEALQRELSKPEKPVGAD